MLPGTRQFPSHRRRIPPWWLLAIIFLLGALATFLVTKALPLLIEAAPDAFQAVSSLPSWVRAILLAVLLVILALALFFGRRALETFVSQPDASPLSIPIPVLELNPRNLKLGDADAASFSYVPGPIQASYDAATQTLRDITDGKSDKSGILIIGAANAGKTRLAYEAMRDALSDWFVLRWNERFTRDDIPSASELKGKNIVILLDDLQAYAPEDVWGVPRTSDSFPVS